MVSILRFTQPPVRRFNTAPSLRQRGAPLGPSKSFPRIALLGHFGRNKFGSDGSLQAALAYLRSRQPDAQIHCICDGEDQVRARLGVPTLPIVPPAPDSAWFRFFDRLTPLLGKAVYDYFCIRRAVNKFDLIAVPGTGVFDDFGDHWYGAPLTLFLWALGARMAGRPFAFVSVGAGPIRHPVSRWLLKSAARMASYRSYRNRMSKAYMLQLGAGTDDDIVTPDLVFSLPVALPAPEPSANTEALPIIGIGVMGYPGGKHVDATREAIHRTYIAKITAFAAWLLNQGYRIRIIAGDEGDAPAIADVVARLTEQFGSLPAHLAADMAGSLDEVIRQMAETQVVVATRFHGVVCALMAGRPVISVGYAEKNAALLADVGLKDFSQHIETMNVELLKSQFERLLRDRAFYEPKIAERMAQYRAQLEEQNARLLEAVLAG